MNDISFLWIDTPVWRSIPAAPPSTHTSWFGSFNLLIPALRVVVLLLVGVVLFFYFGAI